MNCLALFDGISCGQIAFERAGIYIDNYFASEISPDALTVTNYHYPNTIQLGDVTLLKDDVLKRLPKIDILIGGSPCQDISTAKSRGRDYLQGDRSKLFFEYIRILEWIKENNNPEVLFLLENVKSKETVITEMTVAIGVEPIKINSVLVSAQRRERYYWSNIHDITQPEDKGLKIQDIVYDNNYKIFKDERIEKTKSFTKNYVKWDISGKGYFSQQDRAYYLDGTMCTVPKGRPTNKLNIWLGDDVYRRCHPIEAERLQTLPDDYTAMISSPEKRMGLVGDGWTVDIVSHIFSHIPKQLERANQEHFQVPFANDNNHENLYFNEQ